MLRAGQILDGRYEIVAPLGAGGMGQVFRARRVHLGDEVALKVLATEADVEARERFLRESRAAAQLRHPHVVSILDFDVDAGGRPFLVMELLSGPSLREEIALGGAMPAARALPILRAVASAVQLAHDHGIVHRDLKPANVVAHRFHSGERVYKVIDFGIASVSAAPDATRLTLPFTFLGTVAYAAPEQLAGDPAVPATDQYALATLAYELLTGVPPFEARQPAMLAQLVLAGSAVPPSSRSATVPPAADAVIARGMARTPDRRWPSIVGFVEALAEACAGAAAAGAAPAAAATTATYAVDTSVLARYDVGEVLGPGRLGSQVRRGTHRALGIPVAIRHLKRDGQPQWEALRRRFLHEARTLQVRHPHLLHVRDFGEDAAGVFVVTDLVDGPSLRSLLASGPLPWPRAQRLLAQMAEAAGALHRHGGLLTGVTPETIRVSGAPPEEHVVLTTGGIQGVADVLATLGEGALRGQGGDDSELPYLAPEVLLGRPPDARADLFTLAVLAWELTAGTRPFGAPSLPELIGAMLAPRAHTPEHGVLPPAAADAVARCLAVDPAARGDLAALARVFGESGDPA